MCTHMWYLIVFLLVLRVQARVYLSDDGVVELPQLFMAGMTHEELEARFVALETRPEPTAPAPWCPPVGSLMFIDGEAECPGGWTDASKDYEGRYLAVGTTPEMVGEAVDLSTHTATIQGVMPFENPPTDGFNPKSFLMSTGRAEVRTRDVAPAAVVRACRRDTPC